MEGTHNKNTSGVGLRGGVGLVAHKSYNMYLQRSELAELHQFFY